MKRIATTAVVILGVLAGTAQVAQAAVLHGPYSSYAVCEITRSTYPTALHPCFQRYDKINGTKWWFSTP